MSDPARLDEGSRILIIDQDSVRRGMVALTLAESDFKLLFADSPGVGLDMVRSLEPDVVIVGPDTSPEDICQRIHAQQGGSSCLLVLMDEGFADDAEGEAQAEGSGADTYIPFPFERRLLEERLAAGLLRRKLRIRAELKPPIPGRKLQDSGLMEVPALDAAPDSWATFRAKVARMYDRLEAMDYYQLIGVEARSSSRTIKDRYFDLALQMHPDRFTRHEDEQLRHEVYEVYKRLSEAFTVLIDPVSRRQYDAMLEAEGHLGNLRYQRRESTLIEGEKGAAQAQSPLGRRFLYFALRAEEEGRLRTARSYLSLALEQEPENAGLRGRLARLDEQLLEES